MTGQIAQLPVPDPIVHEQYNDYRFVPNEESQNAWIQCEDVVIYIDLDLDGTLLVELLHAGDEDGIAIDSCETTLGMAK